MLAATQADGGFATSVGETFGYAFIAFAVVYVMTSGGPVDATNVIVLYLYEQAFQFFRMGYASAVAYVLFVFIFGLTLFQFYWLRRRMEIN